MFHIKYAGFAAAAAAAVIVLCSCAGTPKVSDAAKNSDSSYIDIPFSSMNWDCTPDDVLACEGSDYRTYDSTYGGTTYAFDKKFNEKNGTIKYMFDGSSRLMCIAWAYGTDNADELKTLYKDIESDVRSEYGDSGYQTDKATNYGGAWYLDNGHIIISTMITADNKALQYSFVNPASYETTASGN